MIKRIKAISKCCAAILPGPKAAVVTISGIVTIISGIITILVAFNQFDAPVHALREKWVNASQWTGVYSSFPEGVVNMEELNLSVDSDVIVFLEYSENEYRIDGYLHSDLFCEKGFSYRNVLFSRHS